ncbi:hypothetical protein HUT19_25860 [Streptomyces sp. NA02950]|uniref:hypothetical protein n=1 Tax=Streptomyces sp. NA02950 TaxID=2742137 RepID=UPI0015910CEE|nr:hypothetical protein [Streptomyces sp. NA02950]QKV94751.1 hypothetical protein HUT19_25860 [Streptomyces sp. NA02950]
MRSVALTLSTVALGTVTLCPVVAAPALADQRHDGSATIRVSRLAIPPGAEVEVRAFGCPGKLATASSPVFVDDAELTPDGDGLFSEATIRSTAASGAHRVTVDCGDRVSAADAGEKVSVAVERPPSPIAPVHAGGGGSAPAEERMREDFGGAEAYGLVLSGGTALVVGGLAVQRRRRRPTGPGSG